MAVTEASDTFTQVAANMGIAVDVPMTDEQAAGFRRQFGEAMQDKPSARHMIAPTPHAARWLDENAPEVKVLVVPHLEMAVMEGSDER